MDESNCSTCAKLRQEIDTVKDELREQKLLDEEIELSKNDELTCSLVKPVERAVVVHKTLCGVDSVLEQHDAALDKLIEASPNLYTLKKRCAYLFAFVQFLIAKTKKVAVKKTILDATYLDSAFVKVVEYVQSQCFGAVVDCLSNDTPDNFEHILKRLSAKAKDPESTRRFNELKTLRIFGLVWARIDCCV